MEEVAKLGSLNGIYLFLYRAFIKEVDADFLSFMRSEEMRPMMEALEMNLSPGAIGITDEALLEELAVEYAALFIQPGAYPPYESIVLEKRFLGKPADTVELAYQDAGFDYRQNFPKLFPDHLAIEMLFIASLLTKESEYVSSGDHAAVLEWRGKRAAFMTDHLGKWVMEYLERLQIMTENRFYHKMVVFTKEFLETEFSAVRAESVL
jgi:TorA maturation chaperone TorD